MAKPRQDSGRRGADLHLPEVVLRELWAAFIPPEKFADVLRAFGQPLPPEEQQKLVVRLVNATAVYRLQGMMKGCHLTYRKQRARLHDIGAAATDLLTLMGVVNLGEFAQARYCRTLHPTVTTGLLIELPRVAVERRGATATLGAIERLNNLLLLLSDLAEAAKRSACAAGREVNTVSDVNRKKRPSAETQLIQSIIDAYAAALHNGPSDSARVVAFDARLRQFVRAGLELAVSSVSVVGSDGAHYSPADLVAVDLNLAKRTTDAALRGAFNRWRAQIRTKNVVI